MYMYDVSILIRTSTYNGCLAGLANSCYKFDMSPDEQEDKLCDAV